MHQRTGIYLSLPLSQPCATTLSVRDKFSMKVLKRAGSSSFTLLIRGHRFGGINLNQIHTKRFKGCSYAFPSDFWISHLECQERSLALLRRTDPNPGMNQGGREEHLFPFVFSCIYSLTYIGMFHGVDFLNSPSIFNVSSELTEWDIITSQ